MPAYTVRKTSLYPEREKPLEIAEDGFILDAEWRSPHRIEVAIAEPVEHGEPAHECDECGDSFDTERGLKIHQGSQH